MAMKEKKARVEDAMHAARAATEEGIVVGGGVALLRASGEVGKAAKKAEGDEKIGMMMVEKALRAPIMTIAENAGLDGDAVVAEVEEAKGNHGYNALTGKYEDLVKAGVVDPAKVTISALQNAASIASLLLTIETMVTEVKEGKKNATAGAVI